MSAGTSAEEGSREAGVAGSQRLDKWLWFARVIKSRTQAAGLVAQGKIRVNKVRVTKPSHLVKAGDVITSSAQRTIRVLLVKAPGQRCGPPAEAETLFEELTERPVQPMSTARTGSGEPVSGLRTRGMGRPTKRDRRKIDRLQGGH